MQTIEHVATCDFIDENKHKTYEGIPGPVVENIKIQALNMDVSNAARMIWTLFPSYGPFETPIVIESIIYSKMWKIAKEIAKSELRACEK